MKKKTYLVSALLLLLVSIATFTIYNQTKVHSQKTEETKLKKQETDKKTMKLSNKKANEQKADAYSIDLKNADAEKIYNAFKGPNADSIINLLEMDKDDSDRILVTTDGTILKGKVGIDESGTEVDTNTDKNSITVKELKNLVLLHKQKIDELASQNSPVE
ncbi:hypothetical protein [Candidatus Enterococcus ikei]|uniref:Lipoprotein n=1 Tax=Candidatus Enterococcus ikei TaxID=2815326 RepID=A0ABS3GZK9_9ENTE|nr:hypothetical protein [Enterococcus sp. DIV0869a]MBO0440670.1 hypothetical protein [Enterococcus sp. DIV0869a]